MGWAEERCVFSCGPYLSASAQRRPGNSCAPSCPDTAVAGAREVEVMFLAVSESLATKQAHLSLLWAWQATKRDMAGTIYTSWLTPAHALGLRISSSGELSLISPDCASFVPLVPPPVTQGSNGLF